jgi:hypothetical protein
MQATLDDVAANSGYTAFHCFGVFTAEEQKKAEI